MGHYKPSIGSLDIFSLTADQRYSLGTDIFLRTHYPMKLRKFTNNDEIQIVPEEQLLDRLLKRSNNYPGNRVWILYGAPGSGKSELMKWIETNIKELNPTLANVTIRISRTELNLLRIIERFNSLLPGTFLNEAIYNRWDIANNKPRTMAKILLLFTLEKLLDSDEDINSLFYRLLNEIQIYITNTLSNEQLEYPQDKTQLISKEAWDSIVKETSIELPIKYEQFQHELMNSFSNHLLEGFSITKTLKEISENVRNDHGLRPVLIIDDLVQSLNIFATDLIDYFITLDEGNWDVVMGVTPASFDETARGRNLLQRISFLDTIDDRVEKFWLTDENGIDSYVINEENCHEFASRYLSELQNINKWENVSALYPFNRECLIRIYRGLPNGKGKARYFLKYLRSILEEYIKDKPLLDAIEIFAHKESIAKASNKVIASICELYGPIMEYDHEHKIKLSETLLQEFGISNLDEVITVEPLFRQTIKREAIVEIIEDEEKIAIRDWLLGKNVNRQLLKGFRQGIARWLRMVYPVNLLYREYIAKPHGALYWNKVYLGVRPPIYLEDVDISGNGIFISRRIGNLAFDIHRYSNAKGDDAKQILVYLASEPSMIELILSAFNYKQEIISQLECQLGMPIEVFALSLYTYMMVSAGVPENIPPSFDDKLIFQVNNLRKKYFYNKIQLDKKKQESIRNLFEDYFKLRENVFDGGKISRLTRELNPEDLLNLVTQIKESQVDKNYRFGNLKLRSVINEISNDIKGWLRSKDSNIILSATANKTIQMLQKAGQHGLLMSETPIEIWSEILEISTDIYEHLRVYLDE
jgi:hypothetical protein